MLKFDGHVWLEVLTLVVVLFQTITCQLEISEQEVDMLPKQANKCNDFVVGKGFHDGQYVFQSPNYPEKYPNSTDCIKLIQAPNPGQVIKLDFRDQFVMEVTGDKCEYDYLEIRDGPYGFSPPLRGGRFCGKKPPQGQFIVSSTQYLWLRFHADDSIEHIGFRGVFEFVSPRIVAKPEPQCRIMHRIRDGQLIFTENNLLELISPNKSTLPHDCTLDFVAPSNAKLIVHLKSVIMSKDGDCNSNYIKVYDGFTISETSLFTKTPKMCRGGEDKILSSAYRRVVLQVFGQNRLDLPQFNVIVTVLYTDKMCKTPLPRGYFDCGDKRCIVDAPTMDQSLVCNGHINCPNEKDELSCVKGSNFHTHGSNSQNVAKVRLTESTLSSNSANDRKKEEIDYHSIILGVIGGLLFIFVSICIFITVRHRRAEIRNQNRKEARQRAIAQLKEDAASSSMTPTAAWTACSTPLEISELLPMNHNSNLFIDNHVSSSQYKQNGFGHAAYPYNHSQSAQTSANSKPNTPSSRRKIQDTLHDSHQQHREDVIIHSSLPRVGRYLAAPSSSMDEEILDSPIQPIANRSGSSPYLGTSLGLQAPSLPYHCRIHSSKQQAFPLSYATQVPVMHQGHSLMRETNHDIIMPPPPPPPLLRRAEAFSMEFYPPNNSWH